jgi:sulfide:quinone oxidoreductase
MQHFNVLIIGAGTAGLTTASLLRKKRAVLTIALIDPADVHYYQPLFTLVGGGITPLSQAVRPMGALIPKGVTWIKERVQNINAHAKEVQTNRGSFRYDMLVVAPGLRLKLDTIPGLEEALADNVVCTNYSEKFVAQTWQQIQAFKSGRAIFTVPNTPIKCGGAPQKIMYLAGDAFRANRVRAKADVVFASALDKIFGVTKYATSLDKVIQKRDIRTLFKHNLTAIDPKRKVATFTTGTGETAELDFSFMHVTPPMGPQPFLVGNPLCNEVGWVKVHLGTLQSPEFPDVFSLGDACDAPTSKTGAAIRKQAPVVVKNMLNRLDGKPLSAAYDGYTSCPLVTGYGKLILAEFDYKGQPCETFPFDQGKERWSMYLLKKYFLPQMYWRAMLQGRV